MTSVIQTKIRMIRISYHGYNLISVIPTTIKVSYTYYGYDLTTANQRYTD